MTTTEHGIAIGLDGGYLGHTAASWVTLRTSAEAATSARNR